MEAPSAGSPLQIALRPFKVGERIYDGADKFDPDAALSSGALDPVSVRNLKIQGYFGPLTRQAYQNAIAQRPAGTVGRGFEPAFLKDLGIIDEVPEPGKERAHTVAEQAGEAMEYRGYKVVPVKVGNFNRFEVLDAEGQLLRATRFVKIETAKAFVDTAIVAKGGAPEAGNGDDVQTGAD